ncbi:ATP-binding protein [Sphingomicrobium sp. XHP0235]|uniref:ATP-binding protein n=1 Tax=Sphingomicrobium aquimarinum TaxID=3133971 RepID=UPI0031FF3814
MDFAKARKVATVELASDRDVVRARSKVAEAMKSNGSSDLMQTRFVTAVSEVVRNALTHANGGTLDVFVFPDACHIGVICRDIGNGIADLEEAMVDGFTTRRGSMGRGLGGAKRLAKTFEIESIAGEGTTVRMVGSCKLR